MRQADVFGECKIGIYVRESRDDNEENYDTIETQRDLLVNFAERNKLGIIMAVYMDDNVSGSAFERQGLDRLKEDVADGRINLLILKDLSRLGRNNAKTLLFLDFLEEYGVRILTFDGRYDSLRDNDTVGIETWFNERYIRDISRKIRASLKYKIEKGEYIGHAPYGYYKSGVEKNRLCIREEAANVVKLIYRLYRIGYGYSTIAHILNGKGFASPGKGSLWSHIAVRRILSNRVYTGDTVQGVSEKVSFKSKKTRRIAEDKWVVTPETHEAIILKDEFEEVQKIRMGKRCCAGPRKHFIHPLRGMLYCGRCGSVMYARRKADGQTAYVCGNYYRKGSKVCTSHFVYESIIILDIINELAGLFGNLETVDNLKHMIDTRQLIRDDSEEKLKRLEQQLLSKQKQQEMLYMDRLEGIITDYLFEKINKSLEERISCLKDDITRLTDIKSVKPGMDLILHEIIERLDRGFITNEIVRLVINRATIYDPGDVIPDTAYKNSDNMEKYGIIIIDFKMNKV